MPGPDGSGPGGDGAGLPDSLLPDSPSGPWVKILSPKDKATVTNPVTFTVAAGKVFTVRLFADDWPLGAAWDPQTKSTLTYTFTGVGYERKVDLKGYSSTGTVLATHQIRITVSNTSSQDKGQLVGQMWNTYYYLASEADYSGAATVGLYDSSCKLIATVSSSYSDAVCIEGSGVLKDGRVINYAKTCSCGRACPTGGIICYSVLDKTKYPWGMGSKGNALVPLRSWATDTSVLPWGTVLYAQQWDGAKIPLHDGIGGFTHDGCFRADDVGGAITGMHYDFFAGTKKMAQALETLDGGKYATKSYATVYKSGGRCAYLKP